MGATFGLFGDPMGFSFYHKKMESTDTLSEGERLILFSTDLLKYLNPKGFPFPYPGIHSTSTPAQNTAGFL